MQTLVEKCTHNYNLHPYENGIKILYYPHKKHLLFFLAKGAFYYISTHIKILRHLNLCTVQTTNSFQKKGFTIVELVIIIAIIAIADTYQYHGESDGATDSTAAGTALLVRPNTKNNLLHR